MGGKTRKKINIPLFARNVSLLLSGLYMLTRKAKRFQNMPNTTNNRIKGGGNIHAPSKIAIILSGRIKGYTNVESNLLNIQKKYNATIFSSLNNKIKSNYIKKFCNTFNITDKQLNLEKTIVPNWVYTLNKEAETSYYTTYSMFYHINKAFNLLETFQNENKIKFDCILFYRADIHSKDIIPLTIPQNNSIYIPNGLDYRGINGLVAYGDFKSMKKYSNIVNHIQSLCTHKAVSFNPEILLKAYLENEKLNVNRFEYLFNLHPSRHEYIKEHDAYE
jgi:hypothetical protein